MSKYIDNHKITRRNRTNQNVGYELTPLLSGKIKYVNMTKKHNMDQIRKECEKGNLQFDGKTNRASFIVMIKADENDRKYFIPTTGYTLFKWNEIHVNADK